MTEESAIPAGRPTIDFRAHRLRHGDGAPYDFENMLAELIRATHGKAHLAFTSHGDWGVDVLKGDLNGVVTIWQAKYYLDEVKPDQLGKIKKSLESALRNAQEHGYRIDKWVLCLPTSFTPKMLKRWQGEVVPIGAKAGVEVDLWDETELRELLGKPEAAYVREAYYNPYRQQSHTLDTPRLHVRSSNPDPAHWRGGLEVSFGRFAYLIHDPVVERTAPDRSWTLMDATAARIDTTSTPVRLHGLRTSRATAPAADLRHGLLAQAEILSKVGGKSGVPTLVSHHALDRLLVVISGQPQGRSWEEAFGTGRGPLDPLAVPAALAALGTACATLVELHRHGQAHRALCAQSIVVSRDGRHALLRDVGLAGLPTLPGEAESGYRAPEQRSTAHGSPGPATDVYQMAALLYHTCTGYAPATGEPMPIRVNIPDFPLTLDELLGQCLHPDPARRPSMHDLEAGLRDGRRQFLTKAVG